ncbi:MAG: hypothetical protein ACK4ND_09810 [Cytophagaceae bacterium]
MSSSLDDQPYYETFQNELDHCLEQFESTGNLSTDQVKIIHLYIEYTCFILCLDKLEQLDDRILENFFHQYLEELSITYTKARDTVLIKEYLRFCKAGN